MRGLQTIFNERSNYTERVGPTLTTLPSTTSSSPSLLSTPTPLNCLSLLGLRCTAACPTESAAASREASIAAVNGILNLKFQFGFCAKLICLCSLATRQCWPLIARRLLLLCCAWLARLDQVHLRDISVVCALRLGVRWQGHSNRQVSTASAHLFAIPHSTFHMPHFSLADTSAYKYACCSSSWLRLVLAGLSAPFREYVTT